ncbi:MAG: S-layer homology domain-containing protein [Clostridiales bacterium]|nr:S-layer homology domain-containing protein [Clostridiales bacterium]
MKRFIAMILIFAVIACGGYAFAAGGGATDPLISLSYLIETVKNSIVSKAEAETEKQAGEVIDGYIQRLENSADFQSIDMSHAPQFIDIALEESMSLELGRFACFMPTQGKLVLRVGEGDVIDISTGNTVPDGTLMTLNHKYFAAENAVAWVVSYSREAAGFIDGYYKPGEAAGFAENEMFYDMFGHWGAEYVYELYNSGVVDGVDDHRFSPNTTVTRGMLVTILGRVHGIDTRLYRETGFTDVSIDKWYGPYVAWAQDTGIVEGYENGTFKPESNITREQMALILMRYAEYVGASLPEEEAAAFADEGKISSWALDAVLYAQRTGLINGKDGNKFDPLGTATRAEMCAVTSRFNAKCK